MRAEQYVSSHNDVLPRNVLFDGKRLWLIDWENGNRNEPLADLATASTTSRHRQYWKRRCCSLGSTVSQIIFCAIGWRWCVPQPAPTMLASCSAHRHRCSGRDPIPVFWPQALLNLSKRSATDVYWQRRPEGPPQRPGLGISALSCFVAAGDPNLGRVLIKRVASVLGLSRNFLLNQNITGFDPQSIPLAHQPASHFTVSRLVSVLSMCSFLPIRCCFPTMREP